MGCATSHPGDKTAWTSSWDRAQEWQPQGAQDTDTRLASFFLLFLSFLCPTQPLVFVAFISDDEQQLADLVMKWCSRWWPFTPKKIEIGFEYAEENYISGFSPEKKAGRKWLTSFLESNPDLHIKNTKNLAIHCAVCTNQEAIRSWFPKYERWLSEFNITSGDQIWNVDESGLQDLPPGGMQVDGVKGQPAL